MNYLMDNNFSLDELIKKERTSFRTKKSI